MVGDAPVCRLALLVEYDGAGFGGSQYQRNTGTIQEALERGLSSLTGEPIRVALAGRTDAGVHARGQVAAFSAATRHSASVFPGALNHYLPEQVAVRAASEVHENFDPRRHAIGRWYRYSIYNSRQRSALRRSYVWQVAEPLDSAAMSDAAARLVGNHDFAAFTLPSLAARQSTHRCMTRAEVTRRGRSVVVDLEANAFLRRQARRIVGTLVNVGKGRLTADEFGALVDEARPGAAAIVAPARGLCLMKVRYEDGLFDDETNEDI